MLKEEEKAKVLTLLSEIDNMVPNENAIVMFQQYGYEPHEYKIIANERGYLRLGIELMKGGLFSKPIKLDGSKIDSLDINIDYIIDGSSDISFDLFQKVEEIDSKILNKTNLKETSTFVAVLFLASIILVLLATGFITILSWIF